MHGRLWCPGVYGSRYQHRLWLFVRQPRSCGNGYTLTHCQPPGNNERSEIRLDINCAHRVWRCCCSCLHFGVVARRTDCYRLTPILRCDMCDIRYRTVDLIPLARSQDSRKSHACSISWSYDLVNRALSVLISLHAESLLRIRGLANNILEAFGPSQLEVLGPQIRL